MQTIGSFKVKTHLSNILEQIEQGEQVVITKHGKPIAKLVPINEKIDREKRLSAIKQLKDFNKSNKLAGLDWKKLRDEGRRYE